ncbi:MAG TPA: hypothetical protein VFW07_05420 [Parafilimonas sp.]|nr:hypothetical protein [Parafilimonas sp.]
MKKFAAISLLLLLLFNFVGYRLLFSVLEKRADNTIVSRIDNEKYNDADLITLTIPLSMPYIQDSKDFEKKDGEIKLNGKIYHYVKQKISQGNLVLMCLPDEEKTHLQNAKDNFFRVANELQNNTSSKQSGENSHVIKLVISDYEELQISSIDLYSTSINNSFFINASFAIQKGEGVMPEQPPDA